MRKLNKKGFTLIELLAAMVILAAIMVIAVPNVMGILNNSKSNAYVEDAKKLLSLAEYRFRSDSSIKRPAKGKCIVMTLKYLDNSELDNAPNNGAYDKSKSFVVVKNAPQNSKNHYVYSVSLVEELENGTYRGIPLKSYEDLYNNESNKLVKNGANNFIDPKSAGCGTGEGVIYEEPAS